MTRIGSRRPAPPRLNAMATLLMAALAANASAAEISTGIDQFTLRWDHTLRYNLGVRTERADPRILNNSTYDESDGKFKRGDVVTNRLDYFTEIDANYRKAVGARVSAAAWYDNAYDNHSVRSNVPGFATSYFNDEYNSRVARYVNGPSGEVLDAFVWATFKVGNAPWNVKVGRQTNYFGEGLLIGAHALSYSQSPLDGVKAVTSPGIETKEVFLPESQIFIKGQVTPSLTLVAQYFVDWHASRLPYGGTYFGPADPFFEGPDRLPVAPNGATLTHVESVRPGKRGNWGVGAKFNVEAIESAFGLYYRQFNDYNPWFGPNLTGFVAIPGVGTVPTAYRLAYAQDVKTVGVSAARVIGPVSVAGDIAFRKGGALNTDAVSPLDNQGPRGNTLHAVVNGVYLLPSTPLWDTGTFITELAYSRLSSVTHHAQLYKAAGSAACRAPDGTQGDRSDDCSTRNYAALAVIFSPTWLQVRPSWDLETPVSLNYGLHGNAPSAGGGSGKALSWSVGGKLTYAQNYEFSLQYADSRARSKYDPSGLALVGGAGSVGTNDRGWLAFTFKAGF